MGKKRIVKKGNEQDSGSKNSSSARLAKKKMQTAVLHVESTFNNTKVLLADQNGGAVAWSSSGSLGFKGAKKGTPFAAAKVGETVADKAKMIGIKEIDVVIKGVGPGRESAMRGFVSRGFTISSIKDVTPVPFNGPKPPKPRRV